MIVPDINLLLYAAFSIFPAHERARAWWEASLANAVEIGIPGPVVFGFIRISTNPRAFQHPNTTEASLALVEAWLAHRTVRVLTPGPRHLEIAFGLLRDLGTAGNLTTDVQLAALAIEYQAELHSADHDFARFPGLRWRNPVN